MMWYKMMQNCAAVCFTMHLTTLARCRLHTKWDRAELAEVEATPRHVRVLPAL